MSFRDLDIKRSYRSFGDDNIAKSLIRPLLGEAIEYKRSVGFFSSSVFDSILSGVVGLARNGGKIKLITSPQLSDEDVRAITEGYSNREEILKSAGVRDFTEVAQEFDKEELNLLSELIAKEILDIKLVVTDTAGIYHDKLGILKDKNGNKVVFYGSPNSSNSGYQKNYEKVRVVKSWIESELDSVAEEEEEFDLIWDGRNEYLETYEFTEAVNKSIISIVEYKEKYGDNAPVELRKYQEDAKDAWIRNGYKGFFVMATGTGKTWTALFSAKEFLEDHDALVVICAPYKHLLRQWAEDVKDLFVDARVILVSSENPNWETEISDAIIDNKYNHDKQIIIISTITSFNGERFEKAVKKSEQEKLLIVDEAHRFTRRDEELKETFKYYLGLSATPYSGKANDPGEELLEYFGGKVFDLPIEKAIGKHLVNYYYHPIIISASDDEETRFRQLSAKIAGCFKNGVLVNKDALSRYVRDRLRLISMAEGKTDYISQILSEVKDNDHFIVYCGDGRLFVDNQEDGIRHIQFIKDVLDSKGFKVSQFTANENMDTRMRLVKAFNSGEIDSLVAIRCLDEGINIPSITSALILSSNDNYREFVQRRGRILRKYKEKSEAHIYDVVVMPSTETPGMAQIELRRYNEYARLAINKDELLLKLQAMMDTYGLTAEDISIIGETNEEEPLDE